MVVLKSRAKLNLFLHVTGKTDQGYHSLDSMAVFADDLYDNITLQESNENKIEISGPWEKKLVGTNIVETVLNTFASICKIPKFDVKIHKNIPIGAGLGGGSSNAAAVIKFLVQNFKPKLPKNQLIEYCKNIGADVTPCYYSRSLYFNGTGEIISPIQKLPTIYGLIIYPNILVDTKDIFSKGFKDFQQNITHLYSFKNSKELWNYLDKKKNDLFNNVGENKSVLIELIDSIKKLDNCQITRMTGSGSACFGLFEDKQSAIFGANTLQKKFPKYSIYITKLI